MQCHTLRHSSATPSDTAVPHPQTQQCHTLRHSSATPSDTAVPHPQTKPQDTPSQPVVTLLRYRVLFSETDSNVLCRTAHRAAGGGEGRGGEEEKKGVGGLRCSSSSYVCVHT